MGRRGRKGGEAAEQAGGDDSAEEVDLTGVRAAALRDRLAARTDGRDDRVVRAAVELRASLDRLGAGVAQRRNALLTRAGEIARAAAPFAGGAVAVGAGALVVASRVRRRRALRSAPAYGPAGVRLVGTG